MIMKKNIRKIAFLVVLAMVASYNVLSSRIETTMSDLVLDNVEALASGEMGTGYYTRYTGQCSYPWYKHWVTCVRGGNEDCYPSDC